MQVRSPSDSWNNKSNNARAVPKTRAQRRGQNCGGNEHYGLLETQLMLFSYHDDVSIFENNF